MVKSALRKGVLIEAILVPREQSTVIRANGEIFTCAGCNQIMKHVLDTPPYFRHLKDHTYCKYASVGSDFKPTFDPSEHQSSQFVNTWVQGYTPVVCEINDRCYHICSPTAFVSVIDSVCYTESKFVNTHGALPIVFILNGAERSAKLYSAGNQLWIYMTKNEVQLIVKSNAIAIIDIGKTVLFRISTLEKLPSAFEPSLRELVYKCEAIDVSTFCTQYMPEGHVMPLRAPYDCKLVEAIRNLAEERAAEAMRVAALREAEMQKALNSKKEESADKKASMEKWTEAFEAQLAELKAAKPEGEKKQQKPLPPRVSYS